MADLLGALIYLLFAVGMLALGYVIGITVENRHFRSLEEREAKLAHIITSNLKTVPVDQVIHRCMYVDGQAVIGSDYFKTFATKVRTFFGGEIRSLERIMERARREATVRMLEAAQMQGATHVYNVRLETSNIGRGMGANKGLIMAEVHVYGTAVNAGHV